jgi:uncharacterized delta-60 repeat protein
VIGFARRSAAKGGKAMVESNRQRRRMMHLRRVSRLFYATALFATSAAAGTNGLDASFGSGGVVLIGATPSSALRLSRLHTIAIDAQDRILLGGIVHDASDPEQQHDLAAIGRLHADGSWDATFGDHGMFVLPYGAAAAPYGGSMDAIAVVADGILVSGTSFQDTPLGRIGPKNSCILLLKLTTGGALDTSFAPDHSGGACFDFAPQGDTLYNYHSDAIAARSDGSFYATTLETNLVSDSTVLGAVARFDASGLLDGTFGSNGVVISPISFISLGLLPDGELLGSGAAIKVGAALLDSMGEFVAGYGTDGVVLYDLQQGQPGSQPAGARLDSQQRLVIGVNFFNAGTGYSYGMVRLDALGHPDATFNGDGQQPGSPGVAVPLVSGDGDHDFLADVQPLADGHLLALGMAGYAGGGDGPTNVALLRLNEDSSFDPSFGDASHPGWASFHGGGAATNARTLTQDTHGKVLAGIDAWYDANNGLCTAVMRIVPDRLLDNGFDEAPVMPTCPQ